MQAASPQTKRAREVRPSRVVGLLSLALLAGCTYDFDQFKGTTPAQDMKPGVEDMSQDMVVEDMPDVPIDMKPSIEQGGVGAACGVEGRECAANLEWRLAMMTPRSAQVSSAVWRCPRRKGAIDASAC